jgi:Protein of unknown function (DUF2939)
VTFLPLPSAEWPHYSSTAPQQAAIRREWSDDDSGLDELKFMRRTTLTIAILALVWIGYIAWPIYDLLVLIRAVENRDIDSVTRHIYFDAVRISLTNQVVDAYVRRTRIQIGPLRRSMAAAAIANPVVEKLISSEALSLLLTVGWPVTVVPDGPPPGTIGITTDTIGTVWQIFENAGYGFGRFEVAGPAVLSANQRFHLEFRLLQWDWRLVGLTLPENIQNLLADELAKALRK